MTGRESTIEQMLQTRFSFDRGWMVAFEVGCGDAGIRRLDAVAWHLWYSHGYPIHGIEVKTARSDWLREVNDPQKHDVFIRQLDYFSVCATPGVVEKSEVPEGWGLLVATGDSLRQVKVPVRNAAAPPQPDRGFVAAFLKALRERRTSPDVLPGFEEGRKRGLAEGIAERQEQARTIHRFEETVRTFEKTSGLRLTDWRAESIAAVVHRLLEPDEYAQILTHMRREAAISAAALAELEKHAPDLTRFVKAADRLEGKTT